MNKIQKKIQIFLEKEQIDFDKITFLAGDASTRKYFLVLRNNKKKVLMCDFYNPSSITKFKKEADCYQLSRRERFWKFLHEFKNHVQEGSGIKLILPSQ